MSDDKQIKLSSSQFLVFTAETSNTIEVRYEDETIWLTQKLMAELFDVDVRTVNEHLKNVYSSGELNEDSTIRNFRIVQIEGTRQVTRFVSHYNLDAIISVGYRINSLRATQFRQWATKVLSSFALRGYVIDRERMENGTFLGEDYFENLLEEIREIRLSERRLYQKVTDIYATAVDYDKDSPITHTFFATVQNKLHYAIHQHTAAELIKERADAAKPHMGLTSWRNGPQGKILRADVTTAKNYLTHDEIQDLGRLVSAYLDLAESRAKRHISTTMEQWAKFLDDVIKLDSRDVLESAGRITKKVADKHAIAEYDRFRSEQDNKYVSDYDRFAEEAYRTLPKGKSER